MSEHNTSSSSTVKQAASSGVISRSIDYSEIIAAFLKCAKHMWLLILILPIVAAGITCLITVKRYTPRYTAYSSFIVNVTNSNYSSAYYNRATASQLVLTFPYIINSGELNNIIAEDLGISYVPAKLSISEEGDTNILTLRSSDSDPLMAYNVMKSAMTNYPKVAEYVVGSTSLTVLDESGVPEYPSNSLSLFSPAVKGALIGFAAAALIIALLAVMNNTVMSPESLKKLVNIPFLGSIPIVKVKKRSKEKMHNSVAEMFKMGKIPTDVANSVRLIINHIERYSTKNEAKVFLVTSTLPGEGKTTVAVQLAQALAEHKNSVTIVDCDFRGPSVARHYNLTPKNGDNIIGLTDFIADDSIKPDSILYTQNGVNIIPTVTPLDNEASEVITKKRMKMLIKALREYNDYVILDTPPCGVISDATALAAYADAMIYVVRQDYTAKSRIVYSLRMLAGSGKPFAGCILNAADGAVSSYYGYYGKYGKYSRYGNKSAYSKYKSYASQAQGYSVDEEGAAK